MSRVVVGMSGGVDSSVAAFLLKEQGHEVIGIFMRNWHDASVTLHDECPWVDDSRDAMLVAEKLGIPFQVLDLSVVYRTRIVNYMFSEYEAGRTPNPDILCNREIKFDVFLKAALSLNADFVATGHYAQIAETENDNSKLYRLLAGADPNKDQSYFLCQLSQKQLSKSIFPIGGLVKDQVREIARKAGLAVSEKKDSQGLCFIGKIKLPEFLQQQLKPKAGRVIEIPSDLRELAQLKSLWKQNNPSDLIAFPQFNSTQGKDIGEHNGAHFYTIGQRKGLHIGGNKEALFVLQTDTVNNLIYVGQGENHPGLYRHGLFIEHGNEHWIRPDLKPQYALHQNYQFRIRYRQALFSGNLLTNDKGLFVLFDQPQKAVAPGQFCAWYQENELLGSGVIS